jgi:FlaA1/EpsC-like NDP-sugar epimerase
MPFSVLAIDYFITIFFLMTIRIAIKLLYLELKNPTKHKSDVIIFGAGEAGIITKRTLDRDRGSKYRVIAFIDEDKKKNGGMIEGIKIYSTDKLDELIKNNNISHMILAIQNLNLTKKQEIIDKALYHGITLRHVPPVKKWINRELSFNQIKHLKIEDLLGRKPIQLSNENIEKDFSNRTILVTGAAGSIGSEIVRQLLKFSVHKVILFDIAESPLYELELELFQQTDRIEMVIGNIKDKARLEHIIQKHKPSIVYHAAAYKHVPLMEINAYEAVKTNILGTKNVIDVCSKANVDRFVLISTDKAINPTNVMGASKRVAELYAQANSCGQMQIITTRFGNVLGSNGSVIPIFKKQLEKGGPITVTDPDVTRFFMTIPEACQLVLEASNTGKTGEVYVFDMGDSVKIIDLAKKMIQLAGLELGKDIDIEFIGLRPGEKLYEEVLSQLENNIPTHHEKILKSEVSSVSIDSINALIMNLEKCIEANDEEACIKAIKGILPEYKSQNSTYEILD